MLPIFCVASDMMDSGVLDSERSDVVKGMTVFPSCVSFVASWFVASSWESTYWDCMSYSEYPWMATVAPTSANRLANVAPMPDGRLTPVISIFLPSSLNVVGVVISFTVQSHNLNVPMLPTYLPFLSSFLDDNNKAEITTAIPNETAAPVMDIVSGLMIKEMTATIDEIVETTKQPVRILLDFDNFTPPSQ